MNNGLAGCELALEEVVIGLDDFVEHLNEDPENAGDLVGELNDLCAVVCELPMHLHHYLGEPRLSLICELSSVYLDVLQYAGPNLWDALIKEELPALMRQSKRALAKLRSNKEFQDYLAAEPTAFCCDWTLRNARGEQIVAQIRDLSVCLNELRLVFKSRGISEAYVVGPVARGERLSAQGAFGQQPAFWIQAPDGFEELEKESLRDALQRLIGTECIICDAADGSLTCFPEAVPLYIAHTELKK